MNMRAATYSRVSTDDQADRGYSLPSQIEACHKYAESLGYSVVVEYSEDVSGATPMGQRPRGARLSEMVGRREVDAVIVYQVDRLSRDIVDLLVTVRTRIRK
jgi:site-specific DNA recombinase